MGFSDWHIRDIISDEYDLNPETPEEEYRRKSEQAVDDYMARCILESEIKASFDAIKDFCDLLRPDPNFLRELLKTNTKVNWMKEGF